MIRLSSSSVEATAPDEFPISECFGDTAIIIESLTFDADLTPNEQYAVISRFDMDMENAEGDEYDAPIPCPGDILVKWRR